MRILGIDPGYATIGFGLLEAEHGQYRMRNYGAITTPAGIPFPRRLEILFDDMTQLLAETQPEALPELPFNTSYINDTTVQFICQPLSRKFVLFA